MFKGYLIIFSNLKYTCYASVVHSGSSPVPAPKQTRVPGTHACTRARRETPSSLSDRPSQQGAQLPLRHRLGAGAAEGRPLGAE